MFLNSLQNGAVLARQAVAERGDQAAPQRFFKAVEDVQRLLLEAAVASSLKSEFQYIPLLEWDPKCKYCTKKGLACLMTSRLSPHGRVDRKKHACQICVVRGTAICEENDDLAAERTPKAEAATRKGSKLRQQDKKPALEDQGVGGVEHLASLLVPSESGVFVH